MKEENPTLEVGVSIHAVRTEARNVVLTYGGGPQPGN